MIGVQPKDKIKTRGEVRTEASQVEDLSTVLDSTHMAIPVSKRSHATFRYIFPITLEERQKSIP